MVNSNQETFKEIEASNAEREKKHQEQTDQLNHKIQTLEERILNLQTELKASTDEQIVLEKEIDRLREDSEKYKREVTAMQRELEEMTSQKETLRQDIQVYSKAASDARAEADRQVLLHAKDIEQLNKLRAELNDIKERNTSEKVSGGL